MEAILYNVPPQFWAGLKKARSYTIKLGKPSRRPTLKVKSGMLVGGGLQKETGLCQGKRATPNSSNDDAVPDSVGRQSRVLFFCTRLLVKSACIEQRFAIDSSDNVGTVSEL